jgi:aminoacylase
VYQRDRWLGPCVSYSVGIKVIAHGAAGHGSSLAQGTSNERLLKCLLKFSEWREEQTRRLVAANGDLGAVTSINITMLQAGKQCNVIPEVAEASIDIRIAASDSIDAVKERVDRCCEGAGLSWTFVQRFDEGHGATRKSSADQLEAIKRAILGRGMECEVKTFPGATDSRFYRKAGIPCFGVSPFRHTPILLHDHNEFMNAAEFLDGIESYVRILRELDAWS